MKRALNLLPSAKQRAVWHLLRQNVPTAFATLIEIMGVP